MKLIRLLLLAAMPAALLPLRPAAAQDRDRAQDQPGVFRVGAGKTAITPIVETYEDVNGNGRFDAKTETFKDLNGNGRRDIVYLAGYGNGREAWGVHDDQWARAIAISRGNETLVMIALDLVGMTYDNIVRIKGRVVIDHGLAWNRVLVACTHTHHGPDTMGLWGKNLLISGVNPAYMASLPGLVSKAVGQALKTRRPARFKTTSVMIPEIVKDIRPPRITDPELSLLQAVDLAGNTVATVANFASHPEMVDSEQHLLSSDYPNYLRERLEARLGGTALFFAGALGGMQTPRAPGHRFEDARTVGYLKANRAADALEKTAFSTSSRFLAYSSRAVLPLGNRMFIVGYRMRSRKSGTLDLLRKDDQGRYLVPCEFMVVRLGDAEFITNPGEMFPELGNRLKKAMTARVKFNIGLAMSENGYIVPSDQWKPDGYEESMSFGKDATPALMKELLTAINSDDAALRAREQNLLPLIPRPLLPEALRSRGRDDASQDGDKEEEF